MSAEDAGPLQKTMWVDLGLQLSNAETANGETQHEDLKLITPEVIQAATSHAGIVKAICAFLLQDGRQFYCFRVEFLPYSLCFWLITFLFSD